MSKDQPKGWLGRIARIAVLSILLATVAALGYGVYAVGLPAWQKLQAEQETLAEALEENQSSYREEFQRLEQSVSDQFANFDGVDRGALNRLEVDMEAAASELEGRQRERQARLLQQLQKNAESDYYLVQVMQVALDSDSKSYSDSNCVDYLVLVSDTEKEGESPSC